MAKKAVGGPGSAAVEKLLCLESRLIKTPDPLESTQSTTKQEGRKVGR